MECVTFDTAEALVAAGSASGTIKLWDLQEAKSKLIYYQLLQTWYLTNTRLSFYV